MARLYRWIPVKHKAAKIRSIERGEERRLTKEEKQCRKDGNLGHF